MDVGAAKFIGAGLAVIALLGVGIGVGNIFSNLLKAIARNPSVKNDVMIPAYIGAALTEAVGILAFTVALIILFS
ncbi:ATP synthase subunit C [Candidatus Paracaedimonas acanthamoebae]|nr:ATP synthase subunit C [Candidatus Paracaedimonas acanthamoebae]